MRHTQTTTTIAQKDKEMALNKAMIIGNLGQDPELRETNSGQSVCNLSVATNRKWKDKHDQYQEETEWHRVTVWGKTAENCAKYLTKGRQVYVEGRLQTREWEDSDGNERKTTEIVAHTVQFLSGDGAGAPAGDDSSGRRRKKKRRKKRRSQPADDDDLPF